MAAQSARAQKDAYQAGRRAAEAGKPETANPYARSLLKGKWRTGWMDGASDAQRAEAKTRETA